MLKLVCPQCQTMISIPEETWRGKYVPGLSCPLCLKQIEVEHRIPQDADNLDSVTSVSSSAGSEGAAVHQDGEISRLNLIEAGGKRGLVCIADQALSAKVVETIKKLDFHVIIAREFSSALDKLEHHQYDLIIVDEMYERSDSRENPVLHYLQHLSMPLRRTSFLCLLSREKSSSDRRAAFRAGVDLILNSQDVEKMQLILNHMIEDQQMFYAVFNNELDKSGTSLA